MKGRTRVRYTLGALLAYSLGWASIARAWVAPLSAAHKASLSSYDPDGLPKGCGTSRERLMQDLLKCFDGEFDNYDQVLSDRSDGMLAGSGGGHEHIHCSLTRLTSNVPDEIGKGTQGGARPLAIVAAKYYFNGDANVVFRYRLYSFHASQTNARGPIEMRLWRFRPEVEAALRLNGFNTSNFDWTSVAQSGEIAERMVGCEIYWSEHHAREERMGEDAAPHFVGLMGENDNGSWISSQRGDGSEILVKDDLKLWPDLLYINDRGFDRDGNFVYGNQRGIPYEMRRVDPNGPLGWTLGREHRTAELYVAKMAKIGIIPRET